MYKYVNKLTLLIKYVLYSYVSDDCNNIEKAAQYILTKVNLFNPTRIHTDTKVMDFEDNLGISTYVLKTFIVCYVNSAEKTLNYVLLNNQIMISWCMQIFRLRLNQIQETWFIDHLNMFRILKIQMLK